MILVNDVPDTTDIGGGRRGIRGSTSGDFGLIMYTGVTAVVDTGTDVYGTADASPPASASLHAYARRRSRRHSSVFGRGASPAQVSPEVLLTPGALETIVIHNGAFVVAESPSSPTSTSRNTPSASSSSERFDDRRRNAEAERRRQSHDMHGGELARHAGKADRR